MDQSSSNRNEAEEATVKTDQNELYSLKVKKEYIRDKRPESLGEIPVEFQVGGDSRAGGQKGKKNRGQNKKRPRDARAANSEKLCLSILRGQDCPFGEKCKFSHDLKAYLNTRPPDLEIEGGCPNFNETGYCIFGAMCRVGSSHLIKATGENIKNENVTPPPPLQNILPKEVLLQLRKRTYKFKCKRYCDRDDKKTKKGNSAAKDNETKKKVSTLTDNGKEIVKEEQATVHDDKEKEANPVIEDPLRPSLKAKQATKINSDNNTPIPSTRKIIDFSNKVYVAPLTTVGNLPFRRIMKKFGADITCGEMAVAGNLLDGRASEWALLKRHPDEDIFGVQIASGYADQYTRVCEVIESHMDVDFVDLNLGCPLDIICSKGAGAQLMTRDKRLKESLEGITKTLSCPVTIKMRTGWDMEKPFAHKLVAKIQSWNIDGIGSVMVRFLIRLSRFLSPEALSPKCDSHDYLAAFTSGTRKVPFATLSERG
jgi:tRNA-dihydrouridine synthase 3